MLPASPRVTRLCSWVLLLVSALAPALRAQPALPTLDDRRAEVQVATAEAERWQPLMAAREARVIGVSPEFLGQHRRVQAIELTAPERRTLRNQGLAGLDAAKRGTFEAAGPAMVAMKAAMADYFEAYDAYKDAEIRARVLGAVLVTLERMEALRPHLGRRAMERLEAEVSKVLEMETVYRERHADPATRNHEKSYAIINAMAATERFDRVAHPHLVRQGLAQKTTWGQRFRKLGAKIRSYARLTRIGVSCLPAAARLFAYLYNPLRKEPDPSKVTDMLRFLGRSYSWGAGMRIRVTGAEHLPKDQRIIYAFSHRSGLEDSIVMISVLPTDFAFMAGTWAFRKTPGLGARLGREPSVILVGGYKDAKRTQRVDAVEEGVKRLQDGIDLALFPEGASPSDHQETRPLRSGLDVIADQVSDEPVAVVAVGIDDPANSIGDPEHLSLARNLEVTVTFSRPIDPLKFKAVPGSDRGLLLDTLRAFYHRSLFRPDVSLETSSRVLGTIPDDVAADDEDRSARFEALHQE